MWSTGNAAPRKAKKIQGRSDQIQFSNLKGIRSFAFSNCEEGRQVLAITMLHNVSQLFLWWNCAYLLIDRFFSNLKWLN